MKKIDIVYESLIQLFNEKNKGISAEEIAEKIDIQRTNASSYLNLLCKQNKIEKINSRPVVFIPKQNEDSLTISYDSYNVFNIIGCDKSLKLPIEQAKAAIIYPPDGLNTIILGPTGAGKSMFANLMYKYSIESGRLNENAPFITFNCADYANNPQLLMSELFGVEKGAYTGADKETDGLLKKADNGILFLDEIHRLPPEGQEMLFTFIDKGCFRKLGSVNKEINAKVRIIAATTENPNSSLLDTFTRRIPMTIKLPALSERTLYERYELVNYFFSIESKSISKSIYVEREVIKAFMLYECKNNIGQLKSDIKTACARAFLDYVKNNHHRLKVEFIHLKHDVKSYLTNENKNVKYIDNILKDTTYIEFIPNCTQSSGENEMSICTNIRRELREINNKDGNIRDINEIIGKSINVYINQFIDETDYNKIKDLLGEKVFNFMLEIRDLVRKELDIEFSNKLFLGLGVHINNLLEKIMNGGEITNPQLNNIRINMPKEFKVAVTIIQVIEKTFNIQVPLDEIGYITLFLGKDILSMNNINTKENVKIILCMHGDTTATSMSQFVNELVEANVVEPIDMPLSMSSNEAYEKIEGIVKKMKSYTGVLIMADMGSLTTFDNKLKEIVNVDVKTIEMVSTPMVLEAAQKVMMGVDLNQLVSLVTDVNPYIGKKVISSTDLKEDKNLIIICHYAEERSYGKVKSTICKNVNFDNTKTEIIHMISMDQDEFIRTMTNLKEHRNIIAIISSSNPRIKDITYISYDEIMTEKGMEKLRKIIRIENLYMEISISLKDQLINVDSKKLMKDLRVFINNVGNKLKVERTPELVVGWILHLCFMVDQILSGKRNKVLKNKDKVMKKYSKEYKIIKNEIGFIEEKYNIHVSNDEVCALVIIIFEVNDL